MRNFLIKLALSLNSYYLFFLPNRLFYKVGYRIILSYLKRLKGVEAIFIRGSFMRGDYIPGASDVDIKIIIENLELFQEKVFFAQLNKKFMVLKKLFPFYKHVNIFTRQEMEASIKNGSVWEINFNSYHKQVYGAYKPINTETRSMQELYIMRDVMLSVRRLLKYYPFKYFNSQNGKIAIVKDNPESYVRLFNFVRSGIWNGRNVELKSFHADVDYIDNIVKSFLKLEKNRFKTFSSEDIYLESFIDVIFTLQDVAEGFAKRFCDFNLKSDTKNIGILNSNKRYDSETRVIVDSNLCGFMENLSDKVEKDKINNIFISQPGCRNYEYKLYIVLKNDLERENVRHILKEIKKIYFKHKKDIEFAYFSTFRYPIVITESIFNLDFAFYKSPLEIFYIKRHSYENYKKIDFKENGLYDFLREHCFKSDAIDNVVSIRKEFNFKKLQLKELFLLFDYMLGILPSTRLMLEKRLIVTSFKEAYEEYLLNYNDETASILEEIYFRYLKDIKVLHSYTVKEIKDLYLKYNHYLTKMKNIIVEDLDHSSSF